MMTTQTMQNESKHDTESYEIISTMAYLSGVEKKYFEDGHSSPKMERFFALEQDRGARVIRNLCMLRTAIEQNFSFINNAMRCDLKNLDSLPQYIPQPCLVDLERDGIELIKANHKLNAYLTDINKLISQHIHDCKLLFPEWLKWDYIRELFIVPKGCTESGVRRHANRYYAHMNSYPYQVYLHWPSICQADIFCNDRRFVTALYSFHGKIFRDFSLVTDAGYATSADVSSFLQENAPAVIAVDCENADPCKLYAMLVSLEQKGLLSHISKIILYSGPNACAVWDLLDYFSGLKVERHILERIKENKSLVDIQMAAGVTREFYQNGTRSFVLASSDSDYWGLISTLPEANYLVVIEEEKCCHAIKTALENADIMYYSMDSLYPSDDSRNRAGSLLRQIADALPDALANFQVQELLDRVRRSACLFMSEAEWRQFCERFVQPMRKLFPEAELLPQAC